MSILSALLGPEALARLREGQPEASGRRADAPVAIDPARAAWHHNKLLERLREQGKVVPGSGPAAQQDGQTAARPRSADAAPASSVSGPARAPSTSPNPTTGRSLDMRLAALADVATLADEHPAIVTRLIRTLAREDRVAILKSLPGPLARMVVKRLR